MSDYFRFTYRLMDESTDRVTDMEEHPMMSNADALAFRCYGKVSMGYAVTILSVDVLS